MYSACAGMCLLASSFVRYYLYLYLYLDLDLDLYLCHKFCDIGVFCEEAARAGGVSCASPIEIGSKQPSPVAAEKVLTSFFFETFQHQNILIVKIWYQNPLFQYMSIYDGHGHVALVFTEELVTGT